MEYVFFNPLGSLGALVQQGLLTPQAVESAQSGSVEPKVLIEFLQQVHTTTQNVQVRPDQLKNHVEPIRNLIRNENFPFLHIDLRLSLYRLEVDLFDKLNQFDDAIQAIENAVKEIGPELGKTHAEVDEGTSQDSEPEHSESVLNSEFDFNVQMTLLDKDGGPCGCAQIVNCYSGLSLRELSYYEEITCPQNYLGCGRIKQFLLELHQGSLQHLRLKRDTVYGSPYKAELTRHTHPMLSIPNNKEVINYEDSSDQKSDQYVSLIKQMLLAFSGRELSPYEKAPLSGFFNQSLSFRVFASIYELIAYQFETGQHQSKRIEFYNGL